MADPTFDPTQSYAPADGTPTFDPNASYQPATGGNQGQISWSDVPFEALKSAPNSAWNIASSIFHTVRHPIDTINAVANTAVGAGEEAADAIGISPNPNGPKSGSEQQFDAVKNYYIQRYGSLDGFKQALARDPVGVMADASIVLGGGASAARAAGATGKVVNAVDKASQITNPVNIATKTLAGAGSLAGKVGAGLIGDVATRAGEAPMNLAYQAGAAGGDASKNFIASINDKLPQEQSVGLARDAVQEMKAQRNAQYKAGMADLNADTAKRQAENKSDQMQYNARAEDSGYDPKANPEPILTFDKVDNKLTELNSMGDFQGYDTDPAVSKVKELVSNEVSNFKNMDPAAFHTPMGFDALKQRLYSIADQYQPGTRERLYVDNAAKAVKDSIVEEAPRYAKVMNDYWEASDLLRQVQSELSLNPKANVGTTLRKLQSVMRNNVNTNYGYRAGLVDTLTNYGAQNLPYQLAGQALNQWTPRGLGRGAAAADILAALATGQPHLLAALPFMSPKLMGLSAYGLGAGRRMAAAPFQALVRNPIVSRMSGYLPSAPTATNLLSVVNRNPNY